MIDMRLGLSLFLMMVALAVQAQPIDPDNPLPGRLEAMKVAFITEKLRLSPEQSQQFWPVYNQYQDRRQELRQEGRPDRSLESMSEAELKNQILQSFAVEEKIIQLKRDYFVRFQEVITIRQIALLNQAEQEFNKQVVERLLELRRRRTNRGGNDRG